MARGHKKLVALLGDPVEHSLSPLMHNAAFMHEGIEMQYLPFRVEEENLESALDGLAVLGAVGANITVPHKEKAFIWVRNLDRTAAISRAVNTILFRDGSSMGFNTDISGVETTLEELCPSWQNAMILGAGGAARGVLSALLGREAGRICISNRTKGKTLKLIDEFRAFRGKTELSFLEWGEDPRFKLDLIVNATSLGLVQNPFPQGLIEGILKWIYEGSLLDMVYQPSGDTELVRKGREKGIKCLGGETVLLHQGVKAYEIFTGKPAPLEIMREALASAGGGDAP